MKMARDINLIVVHASATPPSLDIGALEIRDMHTMPKALEGNMYRYFGKVYTYNDLPEDVKGRSGKGWSDIGYHNVIKRDSSLEHGRDLSRQGAHVKGYNKNSIGICLVGGVDAYNNAVDNFTEEQKNTLRGYIETMMDAFPGSELMGHRDLSPDLNNDGVITKNEFIKECPCFDVREWYYG